MVSSGVVAPIPRDRRADALGSFKVLPDELICSILESLSPPDIGRLACVSRRFAAVPWLLENNSIVSCLPSRGCLDSGKRLHFDGFYSEFLYRRWYRCFTALDAFAADTELVERKTDLTLEVFHAEYDGQKPVLLTGLAQSWPAINAWDVEQLAENHGDAAFRISQSGAKKILMKFKDYLYYMKVQHDEDPLYVFDDEFGEVAPGLLKDYSVPHLFQEDFFDVLEKDKRPPFRWLVIGPQRSGASWHVDPALTSAWNTLLTGRKRWALYPPGRVPSGVTVHVNEEDGDVNIETPPSLQWWLDFYPLLAEHEKPLECTQLPGETIFVPSGWWHCVLNLEDSVAVTQNFVNASNFEFVCLDMAPGYHHKGVSRAGTLAINDVHLKGPQMADYDLEHSMVREGKRLKVCEHGTTHVCGSLERVSNGIVDNSVNPIESFSYSIDYLSRFLEGDTDHYNSCWCLSNVIGQREFREWLHKLWVQKPGLRDLIWKGACIALDADKWLGCLKEICSFHNLPLPSEDRKLPVSTGSNPVYLTDNHVIKIYAEGGLEFCLNSLGTEIEFYSLLHNVPSPLNTHVPDVFASGFLLCENGDCKVVPWNGKEVPDSLVSSNLLNGTSSQSSSRFGLWSKKQLEFRAAGKIMPVNHVDEGEKLWPYLITRRCNGELFANLRDVVTRDDMFSLASFLGEQVRNLHTVPLPPLLKPCNANSVKLISKVGSAENSELGRGTIMHGISCHEELGNGTSWAQQGQQLFVETMNRRMLTISDRLAKWGDPIPRKLVDKVVEYLPHDFGRLLDVNVGIKRYHKFLTWIHMDIMDDNVYMEPCSSNQCLHDSLDANIGELDLVNVDDTDKEIKSWRPSYILDFSDLSFGDPLMDFIPIYLDIFRGNSQLLGQFLRSYGLPLMTCTTQCKMDLDVHEDTEKFRRISYHAMCYCILHEENVMGVIFKMWKELRKCESWEEVETAVWGDLNNHQDLFA